MSFLADLDKTKKTEQRIEEAKKIKEELSKTPDQNTPTENLLKQYDDLRPLKFVDTVERGYHNTFLKNSKKESLHILSSYKNKNNVKLELLEFELKPQISSKLSKKTNQINCLRISGEFLFSGDKDGISRKYKIETGVELKKYTNPEKEGEVTVIDILNEHKFLLVGYLSGTISIFETESKGNNLLHNIKGTHITKITAIKFIEVSNDKKKIEIFSADEEGQVKQISINSSGIFSKKTTIQENLLFKDTEPTFGIIKFTPTNERSQSLCGFLNINKVRIYLLSQKISPFFEIKRPKYLGINEDDAVPDISFGWGCLPLQDVNIQKKLAESARKIELLLSVAWGNVISIYVINILGEKFNHKGPVGYFENGCKIIRLGFLSQSIIYFFDKNAQLKILNTAFLDYGEFEKIENKKFVYNKNALVDEGRIIDARLIKNNISKDKNIELDSYRNFIFNMKKCIFLFSSEGFRIGKVLTYEDCIEGIIKNSNNWFGAMCLGIDIYQGNITSFPGVPINETEREKLIGPYLLKLLDKYIDSVFQGNKNSNYITEDDEVEEEDLANIKDEKVIECMNVAIEFCIAIKAIDFLLNNVELTFNNFGKGDLFYKLFEPFIFNDLLFQEKISEAALTSLYVAYKTKNELILLSHLLTHINYSSLNTFAIKKLVVGDSLYSLLIFIFSNGKGYEDFFFPISKMYCTYIKKEQQDREKKTDDGGEEKEPTYISYSEKYGKDGMKGINAMSVSKEYIGHLLLWYIEMSLRGNKYATGMDVNLLKFDYASIDYKRFIATIYFWMLQEKIFKILLNFDSYSLFTILSELFTDNRLEKIIKNFDFSVIKEAELEQLIKEQDNNVYFTKRTLSIEVPQPLWTFNDENGKNENAENEENKKEEEKEKKVETKTEETKTETKTGETKTEEKKTETKTEEKKPETKNEEKKSETKTEEKKEESDTKNTNNKLTPQNPENKLNLNDIHSVILYIINVTESQPGFFQRQDLGAFLIKYISKAKDLSIIPANIKNKAIQSYKNYLNYFKTYKKFRPSLIKDNEDKFNCHSLYKETIDSNDFYFTDVYKTLRELLDSNYPFTEKELEDLFMAADETPFTLIKIKIAELSKNYPQCLSIYIKQKDEKLSEDVFAWLERIFEKLFEIRDSEIYKDKSKELEKQNLIEIKNLQQSVIEKISELGEISTDKTKKIVKKFFPSSDKLNMINKLDSSPKLKYSFLVQLFYPSEDDTNEEEVNDNNNDSQPQTYFDLFKVNYDENTRENVKEREEKKIKEQFEKLIITQIELLITLNETKEILPCTEKNIKLYTTPVYPIHKALNLCIEKEITDTAVYLYQVDGDNKGALELTKKSLFDAFYNYLENNEKNDNAKNCFLKKLEICINICKDNSENLSKKSVGETPGKETNKEGEDLWFNLLETLYDFQGKCENTKIIIEKNEEKKEINITEEKQKKVKETLQERIEDLLKQMCLYVSIQNLITSVSENGSRAQYKEFKSILESMLRTNSSFDRVLTSILTILQNSIGNSENKRMEVTLKGNIYNYKICDVCHQPFQNNKYENIYFFGCGHQSHDYCCYVNDNYQDKKNELVGKPQCKICHQNEIQSGGFSKKNEEDDKNKKVEKVGEEELNQIKIHKGKSPVNKEKVKSLKYGSKNEKMKKLNLIDKKYDDKISLFY